MKPHDAGGQELKKKRKKNDTRSKTDRHTLRGVSNIWSFKHLEPVTEV
jgi:hypothetical protein